jgi:hypothetical protein
LCYVADREGKYVENGWNDTDREKTKYLENFNSTVILSVTKTNRTEMGTTPVTHIYSVDYDGLNHKKP